jgi:hypothetical protein
VKTRKFVLYAAPLFLLLVLGTDTPACTWVQGYFHQVTHLNGRVVGRSLGFVQFQWLRRMYSVGNAELLIYNYNQPSTWHTKALAIAATRTNSAGEFEFNGVQQGHYLLVIDGGSLRDSFEVEITSRLKPTKSILIDISPTHPDCTGGHEMEISSKN